MKGKEMRKLFVKGEVLSSWIDESTQVTHCSVNITNDGWHVCQKHFSVKDENDLETQFFAFLESDVFQNQL